ncbi:hypothetical protein GCM10007036_22960 [Alsobacter metallidurans]|uniref:Uncharacterized protein n=1 Tax=Alsobacter metallidurans TaxID=340221 RepID=A0A917I735_9HYPH|nr:hypothetical protein [Alsobacter metallidurans]GGH19815.1 hypothetical protein GCM10007036_22960 [Alsobacter metallidurans]
MANSALALNALAHVGSDRQPRAGLLSMIIEGIKASRRRQAEQVVANYIQLNGGRLTDDLEREISRKFGDYAG